jgi:hypothetical protein
MVAKIGDKLVTIIESNVTIHSKQKIVVWKGSCIVIEPDLEGKTGTLFVMRKNKDKENEWDFAGGIGEIEFKLLLNDAQPNTKLKMFQECNKSPLYEYEIKVTKVLK